MNNLEIVKYLSETDWSFADYNSSMFPFDINTLHWYPGTFVPIIPAVLIQLLSGENDIVFDPFAGTGITAIESLRQNRVFYTNEINPFANNIIQSKIASILTIDNAFLEAETKKLNTIKESGGIKNTFQHDQEKNEWFHVETLKGLSELYNYIIQNQDSYSTVRKTVFSSILNFCSVQKEHYTYITDNCRPNQNHFDKYEEVNKRKKRILREIPIDMFIKQLTQTCKAAIDFRNEFKNNYGPNFETIIGRSITHEGDSKSLQWIDDSSIDLIVTSPPYVGVNDYVRSMRLTHLFFPEVNKEYAESHEIGARYKRNRKNAFSSYIEDMKQVVSELNRIIKEDSFVCLIIGQSKGKFAIEDSVQIIMDELSSKYNFELIYKEKRNFKFRRIGLKGIGHEWIIVMRSPACKMIDINNE